MTKNCSFYFCKNDKEHWYEMLRYDILKDENNKIKIIEDVSVFRIHKLNSTEVNELFEEIT